MQVKQGGFSLVETMGLLGLFLVIAAVGFTVFHKNHSSMLSAEQIDKKFDCHRITENVRPTDVFCQNPKFYNDPDGITYEDYYKYYGCEERLKSGPPPESAKTDDPGYYEAYFDCKDRTKLNSLRQDFIKQLGQLKAKNS